MDTFFEQIVSIRKSVKEAILLFAMWIFAGLLSTLVFLILAQMGLLAIGFLVAVLIFYGTYRLSQNFFIEFEYIVTNNILDVDKIIAKSKRKRIASVEIPNISDISKFNPAAVRKVDGETRIIACDPESDNAYEMTVKDDKSVLKIVMAPNDRIKDGLKKALPKYIANSAFRGE